MVPSAEWISICPLTNSAVITIKIVTTIKIATVATEYFNINFEKLIIELKCNVKLVSHTKLYEDLTKSEKGMRQYSV